MRFFFNVFLQTKVTVNCEKTKSSLNKKSFSCKGCFYCWLFINQNEQLEYFLEPGKEFVGFLHAETERR